MHSNEVGEGILLIQQSSAGRKYNICNILHPLARGDLMMMMMMMMIRILFVYVLCPKNPPHLFANTFSYEKAIKITFF